MNKLISSVLCASVAVATGFGAGACSVNPVTGESSLTLLSWEREKAIGAQAAPEFTKQFGGEVESADLQAYVRRVGMSLVEQVEPSVPDLPWEFTLLDSPEINAFSLPGGKVFITRGLAVRLNNEAQLAGVLGHEIGHVTARHGNQRISRQIIGNIALTGAQLVVGAAEPGSAVQQVGQYAVPALNFGGNLVLLSYGRDEEHEADKLGMRYMTRAGYDPVAQRQVMHILAEASRGPRTLQILATHPYPEERIEHISELLRTKYAYTQNNPEYKLYEQRYQEQFLSEVQGA